MTIDVQYRYGVGFEGSYSTPYSTCEQVTNSCTGTGTRTTVLVYKAFSVSERACGAALYQFISESVILIQSVVSRDCKI